MLVRQLLDAVAGHLRHAAGAFHRNMEIFHPINAELHIQPAGVVEGMNLVGNNGNQLLQGRQGRKHYKMVVGKAGNQIVREILPQHLRHFDKELISLLTAVPKIIETEIVNIHINKSQLRRLGIQGRHGHGHGCVLQETGLPGRPVSASIS